MAGLRFALSNSDMIAGTNGTWVTFLRVTAPAAIGVRLRTISINSNGVNPTQGKPEVRVAKGTSGGTAGGGTVNIAKKDGHTGSVQTTATENYSVQPTVNANMIAGGKQSFHPQSGITLNPDILLNPGESADVQVKVSGTLSCVVHADCEE